MIWSIPTLEAERTHLRPFIPADAPEVELLDTLLEGVHAASSTPTKEQDIDAI